MTVTDERWLIDRRATVTWHRDGSCYMGFRREPDGLAVSVHGVTFLDALRNARALETRALSSRDGGG